MTFLDVKIRDCFASVCGDRFFCPSTSQFFLDTTDGNKPKPNDDCENLNFRLKMNS